MSVGSFGRDFWNGTISSRISRRIAGISGNLMFIFPPSMKVQQIGSVVNGRVRIK